MDMQPVAGPTYTRIHALVSMIPPGHVSTYGRIAAWAGGCTPRMVGYALAALPVDSPVPWQRVVNAQGKISPRANGLDGHHQRIRLEAEGIEFDAQHRIDLDRFAWEGPPPELLAAIRSW